MPHLRAAFPLLIAVLLAGCANSGVHVTRMRSHFTPEFTAEPTPGQIVSVYLPLRWRGGCPAGWCSAAVSGATASCAGCDLDEHGESPPGYGFEAAARRLLPVYKARPHRPAFSLGPDEQWAQVTVLFAPPPRELPAPTVKEAVLVSHVPDGSGRDFYPERARMFEEHGGAGAALHGHGRRRGEGLHRRAGDQAGMGFGGAAVSMAEKTYRVTVGGSPVPAGVDGALHRPVPARRVGPPTRNRASPTHVRRHVRDRTEIRPRPLGNGEGGGHRR
jgi:hypothetical protein